MKLVIEGSAEEIQKFINGDVSAKVKVDGSETCVSAKPKLTRADVVAKAKRDVEELKQTHGDHEYYYVDDPNDYSPWICREEFIVDREKRTVVALLKGVDTQKVRAKGIAKCAPDDCFNADIGKAIALRRALGLEVPDEYLNAPQPKGVAVGDVIRDKNFGIDLGTVSAIKPEKSPDGRKYLGSQNGLTFVNKLGETVWMFISGVKVIDDTDREEYRSVAE